jgi:arabinan endo-1,5-alpha-L-arabinosidase
MIRRRRVPLVALASAGLLVIAGCSADATGDGGSSGPSVDDDAEPAFVIDQDFPDPDVIAVDGLYYAYATNTRAVNVQYATSPDLETWSVSLDDVFPELPVWAETGRTWAPDVTALPDGRYALYFTAQERESGRQCIGVAVAAAPTGPFVSDAPTPLICPLGEGGAIDASSFVDDDGSRYLAWKNDGNCCGLDTWLRLSMLTADGLAITGEPVDLVKQTEAWEGTLVEAPVIVRHGNEYALFYSANDYGGEDYAMGYALAPSVAGPYTKGDEPLFTTAMSGDRDLGPGGQDVIIGPDGEDRIVYHSWDPAFSYRGMTLSELEWPDGVPVVEP